MQKDDYWELFWASGMPEAWMLSRTLEGSLLPAEMVDRDLKRERSKLPEEARQLRQNQAEAQNLTAE